MVPVGVQLSSLSTKEGENVLKHGESQTASSARGETCSPSSGSRLKSNENSEEEVVAAPPPFVFEPFVFELEPVVDDPVALDVVDLVDPEYSVVDPEVVDVDNVVVVIESDVLTEEDRLDEDLSARGSSSCGGNGTV